MLKSESRFSQLIEFARANPLSADIRQLCSSLISEETNQNSQALLGIAGVGLTQIVEIFVLRAEILLWDWEHNDMPEPVLLMDDLAGVLRQSMTLNLESLLAPAPPQYRGPRLPTTLSDSQAYEVDKDILLDLIDDPDPVKVAHDENITAWTEALETYLAKSQHVSGTGDLLPLPLLSVQQAMDMSLVEVWLGAIHSQIIHIQQRGDFYDANGIVLTF